MAPLQECNNVKGSVVRWLLGCGTWSLSSGFPVVLLPALVHYEHLSSNLFSKGGAVCQVYCSHHKSQCTNLASPYILFCLQSSAAFGANCHGLQYSFRVFSCFCDCLVRNTSVTTKFYLLKVFQNLFLTFNNLGVQKKYQLHIFKRELSTKKLFTQKKKIAVLGKGK